jgi:hypothetical protein
MEQSEGAPLAGGCHCQVWAADVFRYQDLSRLEDEIRRLLQCEPLRTPACMEASSYANFRYRFAGTSMHGGFIICQLQVELCRRYVVSIIPGRFLLEKYTSKASWQGFPA